MPVSPEKVPKGISTSTLMFSILALKFQRKSYTVYQQEFPIQLLQPEVLAVVFISCLPEIRIFSSDDVSTDPVIGSKYAPLLLCNVCSSWRNLAISTPRLWQTLDIVIRRTLLDPGPLVIGIRTWLERSGTLPLTIILRVFANNDWSLSSQIWPVFQPLFQCASRWERCYSEGILNLPCLGALPVLRVIDIDSDEVPFISAPCLKSVSFGSLPSTSGSSLAAIPWDQLTDLNIHEEQLPSMFLDIIKHCPRLQSLSLSLVDPDEQIWETPMPTNLNALGVGGAKVPSSFPITHNILRCLRLSFMSFPHALFEFIVLPSLIELKCGYDEIDEFPSSRSYFPQLLVFFTQSNCQLQELSLIRSKFTPNELLECLKHRCCQTLSYLMIENSFEDILTMFNKELLILLTYSEDNTTTPICPKLAQIELYFCYLSQRSSPDLLGRMIHSRCFGRAQGDRLESFHIESLYPLSRGDHDLLRFAKEKGGLDLFVGIINDESSDGSSAYIEAFANLT